MAKNSSLPCFHVLARDRVCFPTTWIWLGHVACFIPQKRFEKNLHVQACCLAALRSLALCESAHLTCWMIQDHEAED